MDFSWNSDQIALKERVIEFSRTLNECLADRENAGQFPKALWKQCAEFGIQGFNLPEAYGGMGLDLPTTVLAMEALGYGCRDNGLLLALNAHIWCIQQPLHAHGSDEQKQRFLPSLRAGDLICTQAISEPSSGSDALSMQTRADKVPGGYVLNGTKCYIGLAPIADYSLIYASTDREAGQWGISLFMLDNHSSGCTVHCREKMGTRTNPMGNLLLEDCFIPESSRIGLEGAGLGIFNQSMEWERSFILASYVGSLAYQLEQSVAYAQQRHQYGKPIGQFQSVSNRVADMKSRLEIAKLLLYRQAWLKQNNLSATLDSAITKLFISESFLESSLDTLRIHGASGYTSELGIERDFRDSVGAILYAGTSDIQRNIIAKLLGL